MRPNFLLHNKLNYLSQITIKTIKYYINDYSYRLAIMAKFFVLFSKI